MKKQRAFLKWAGGKYGLVEDIQRHLPSAEELVEPFVGAGSIFLTQSTSTICWRISIQIWSIYTIC